MASHQDSDQGDGRLGDHQRKRPVPSGKGDGPKGTGSTMGIGKDVPCPYRFSMVPNALFTDRSLEPIDCLVWCHLCLNARGRGFADPTDKSLAEAMGIVDRTVKRSLARLEDAGFIRRERNGPKRIIHLIPDNRANEQTFRLVV